ncbi:hypothetical protein GCM10008090_29450 [Arenicella chitinivorans]|uniref:Uncharacterized protein n=1 Tax=Arenicella chitinivorans TaxID=1329800 RepID=A0A918VPR7_9GAMM|nr:hypothetical protein [Arenicella chitinivorans]GHA17852.1 hypothetical protein GCM10008090_29450 [Arenicella chitinivorans]
MRRILYLWMMAMSLMLGTQSAQAQEILLDQMQSAAGLKLFPLYGDTKSYVYMPDKIAIPEGADGKKQFSFLKFVNDDAGSGDGGIQNVDGGGLVTFLVNFEVPDQTVQRAQSELQQKVPGAKVIGPLSYRSGTFALVSEFQQEDGDWAKRVLGLGKAPVMEGHKAAVSIRLTKTGATILWESFKQSASNINVSFEMIIAGYRNPYEARMTAWWERIAKNKALNVGLRTDYLGVDIQNIMKELKDTGAIELEVKGEDAKLDRLWEMAYGKLAAQMFEQDNDPTTLATLQDDPNAFSNFDRADQFNADVRDRIAAENKAELQRVAEDRKRLERHGETWPFLAEIAKEDYNTDGKSDEDAKPQEGNPDQSGPSGAVPAPSKANLKTPPSFALLASYRKKQFKKSGKFELNFKKWTTDTQSMRFDENIGGFGKRMFNDPSHFRVINLNDPAYKIREILVQLDGQDSADFDKFVNFVTVQIRKTHQDGFKHVEELKINQQNFNQAANNFTMKYGYHGDQDRARWLDYEYRINWNLYGGASWSSDWQSTNDFIIPVVPPHQYREVVVEADPAVFSDAGVRLATVEFKSDLFGKQDTQSVSLKTTGDGTLSKTIRYAHEPNDYGYLYDISWLKRGNVQLKRTDIQGNAEFIFADELPEEE